MPTPSLYPLYMKAQFGGGGPGDPVYIYTGEPISLDMVTSDQVSLSFNVTSFVLSLQETPVFLDLSAATIIAQQGGELVIDAEPIELEFDI